jgi:hypothetical protein
MKKLSVLVMLTIFCIAGMAAVPAKSWIVTKNDVISCEKIHIGIKNARVVLENGEKMVIPIGLLNAYSINGQVYNKKMLFKNGKPSGQMVFMQLLNKRGDLCLYKNVEFDPESVAPLNAHDGFYIYKGDEVFLALDKKTMPNVFPFFRLKLSYK